MFWKKKKVQNTVISMESINFDPDTDKVLLIFREDSKLSPKQMDEIIAVFDNIEKYKTIMLPHEIKEIKILHKTKE